MSNLPNTIPFPVVAGTSSPLFNFAPIASNSSSGWATTCTNSACASTATWSTRATDATVEFSFYGIDCALEGSVQGTPNVEMTLDGNKVDWNPANGTLFSLTNLNQREQHKIQLKVLSASSDAQLNVGPARVGGATDTPDSFYTGEVFTLNSDNKEFSYTGFVQQTASVSESMAPVNYISSNAGDTAKINVNASTIALYGPCGPSSGMVSVSVDNKVTMVNATKPIQADDCMLFLSGILSFSTTHEVVVTNTDGRTLGLNRLEAVRTFQSQKKSASKAGMVVGIVLGVIVLVAIGIITYSMRSKKTRDKMNRSCSLFCS